MARIAPFPGVGVDRVTGRVISGWDHVLQSLGVIFTTRHGERVIRRWFGSFVPAILGRNMTQRNVIRFWTAVCVAIDLWEPRYKVTRIIAEASPEQMRLGSLGFVIEGQYRPRGHLGDFTVEGPRRLAILRDGRALTS